MFKKFVTIYEGSVKTDTRLVVSAPDNPHIQCPGKIGDSDRIAFTLHSVVLYVNAHTLCFCSRYEETVQLER